MLSRESTGLIIVDVQGKLAKIVHDSTTVLSNIATLVQAVKLLDMPIILLEQNPEKLGRTNESIRGLLPDLSPVTKFTFDACKEPEFTKAVESLDVSTWLLCGIEAHICVYQTAQGLVDSGWCVEVVEDCISSRTKANKELAISKYLSTGIGITGLEMCLYELVQDCRDNEFKEILNIVK